MGQKLVIVESPTKVKTIKKYLGSTYVVEATMGHVRDLPKSQLGVDIENNYEPKYITIRGKGSVLEKLRKEAKKAEKVYLATDPDREGEAISWHLAQTLKIEDKKIFRIEFNEITKTAVKNAIKNPRTIDEDLVDAQQARRVLDRLVGYEISPILWKKVKWGLSAGRVQSATLKVICDREKEINQFVPEEYWTIEAKLKNTSGDTALFKLTTKNGKKLTINNSEMCSSVSKELENKDFIVKNVSKQMKEKSPLPPFTTSTLQQDANRKLGFTTQRTMMIAQKLYEGIDIKGHGTVGLITYMRTDSVRVSSEAQSMARDYILEEYGKEYAPSSANVYKSKKDIQDAHEAIRPSDVSITPELAKDSMKLEEYKMYKLIWSRFVASQMSNCKYENTSIDVVNGDYGLKTTGNIIIFNGFTKVYENNSDELAKAIPVFQQNETLHCVKKDKIQHFTQPPARFTEASLIKAMEENGIGRPSTYAPTIGTLLGRKYIEREKKNLIPTELGFIVNDIMSQYFANIVDVEFTACMEEKLDEISVGNLQWKSVVDEFFTPVKKLIEVAENEISKVTIEDEVTDIKCEKCGKFMVIKKGRYGDFLACPGYPECKNTKPIVEEIDIPCPKCGGKVLVRKSKKGNKFYGCSNYPECNFVSWYEPTNEKCPVCGEIMVKRFSKAKGDYLSCSNPECKYKQNSQ
ncbi:DNA topoisomerase I [Hathewaya proteolytica DSM 3090]|uniref:DNA topoisomerase 1 n=1 Tax=Hathewaya proteolytica DSM 3090 TaxID=1121331 RepID=A0A1M6J743_9CLOT|nr:type I DNA topoisomerase [Hathewaya proteolytica]SHJ42533.1 DNA topoisomerase I [Hathewaya proteolytica DSM 3090]